MTARIELLVALLRRRPRTRQELVAAGFTAEDLERAALCLRRRGGRLRIRRVT
jgi:hypothetical protein